MGKKTPTPPAPPDPTVVANAQSQANIASAEAQQKLNMVNSYGPDGSVTYQQDPNAPGGYSQNTTLSPGQQALYDQYNRLQQGALGTAGTALNGANEALGQHLNVPSANEFFQKGADNYYNAGRARLDDVQGRTRASLENTLSNQGLNRNDEAWTNAVRDQGYQENDANNQLLSGAYTTGANLGMQGSQQQFQNQAYAQNQPINQFSALLGLGQVGNPQGINYSPASVGQTDVTGAYALNQAGQNANYQAQLANQSSGLGGLFSLGSAAIGAGFGKGGFFNR